MGEYHESNRRANEITMKPTEELNIAQLFLADPHAKEKNHGLLFGHFPIISLLQGRVDATSQIPTPLHVACTLSDFEVARILLEYGASVDLTNK